MQITNTTQADLGLDPEHMISAGQTVEVDDAIFERSMNSPVVRGWVESGALVAAEIDAGDDDETMREDIETMGKGALIAHLEAHGVDVDKRLGVEKLREQALAVTFIEA